MTQERFHELIHIVLDSLGSAAPPHDLFAGGVDDWHARARLAHFLAQRAEYRTEALELFQSVVDAEPNEELAQDVEEKVYAMQGLSALEATETETQEAALEHINLAIECAESTDFLYKYILRGELWADRWNLMHKLRMTEEAEAEADERIAAFDGLEDAVPHNSYLYYGYRFKAHLAAERGVVLIAKDYMHMAIHAMEMPSAYEQGLADAFAATHENAPWILREIDRATPNPEHLHWDI
ncbi:hypothetical protein HMPREF1992_00706 [Selenomonas sp. oral taxon 892 str. F0426]|uniref:hypothetical protein n=1 Tax=Selenomonas sp. oral taxon 892 TaxID=1321785 RepID=UPI0003AD1793|nr:hypothetical protein [Selenomonas sp. oral taxon 892]ERJ95460.1 hypothetical protein HMPREF1992_00706 [Selenomonas sp. oral taxon 892 str. F0426]